MIWYDMVYDMIWYDVVWYDIVYDMIRCDMIWYGIWYMIRYVMVYDMVCDMIWYIIFWCIYLLGRTPLSVINVTWYDMM